MKIAAVCLLNALLHASVFQIINIPTQGKDYIFGMSHIHTHLGVGHNPCYTPTNIDTVTGGSGSIEMAVVCSINAVLHTAVFQIIDIPTHGKKKHIWEIFHAYTMKCGP